MVVPNHLTNGSAKNFTFFALLARAADPVPLKASVGKTIEDISRMLCATSFSNWGTFLASCLVIRLKASTAKSAIPAPIANPALVTSGRFSSSTLLPVISSSKPSACCGSSVGLTSSCTGAVATASGCVTSSGPASSSNRLS